MTSSSMVRADRKWRRAATPCSPASRVLHALAAILSITTLVNPTTISAMTAFGADKLETSVASGLLQDGITAHNGDGDGDYNSTTAIPNCQRIRNALAKEFPEVESLYSDAYLESIAAVPGRPLEYAIHHNVKRALEWRRSHKVDDLLQAFETVDPSSNSSSNSEDEDRVSIRGKLFVPKDGDTDNGSLSRELVEVCRSGAFCVLDEPVAMKNLVDDATNGKNPTIPRRQRLVLYADTSKLNWWKTGVAAGLQYHVLVLEDAFARIRRENQDHPFQHPIRNDKDSDSTIATTSAPWLEESLLLCVDTTAPPWLPPPLGALRGMVRLLQKAYPDRIHQIYVGPVSPWLRALWGRVRPWIKPKIRNKITLLGEAPSEVLNRWRSSSNSTAITVSHDER